jgi:hypothetical protein
MVMLAAEKNRPGTAAAPVKRCIQAHIQWLKKVALVDCMRKLLSILSTMSEITLLGGCLTLRTSSGIEAIGPIEVPFCPSPLWRAAELPFRWSSCCGPPRPPVVAGLEVELELRAGAEVPREP